LAETVLQAERKWQEPVPPPPEKRAICKKETSNRNMKRKKEVFPRYSAKRGEEGYQGGEVPRFPREKRTLTHNVG